MFNSTPETFCILGSQQTGEEQQQEHGDPHRSNHFRQSAMAVASPASETWMRRSASGS